MSGEHLSFMKYTRDDDIAGFFDVKHHDVAGMPHRRIPCAVSARSQMIGEISLADLVDGSHTDSAMIVADIPKRSVQQAPVM